MKTTLFATLPILGFSVSLQDPALLEVKTPTDGNESASKIQISENDLRIREATHLEVYAGCKWGKASFAPERITSEPLSIEIQALYERMA